MKDYGETHFEKSLKKKQACRDIVQEIMNFGINQTQLLEILYLLSLEISDRTSMIKISKVIKNINDDDEEKVNLSI